MSENFPWDSSWSMGEWEGSSRLQDEGEHCWRVWCLLAGGLPVCYYLLLLSLCSWGLPCLVLPSPMVEVSRIWNGLSMTSHDGINSLRTPLSCRWLARFAAASPDVKPLVVFCLWRLPLAYKHCHILHFLTIRSPAIVLNQMHAQTLLLARAKSSLSLSEPLVLCGKRWRVDFQQKRKSTQSWPWFCLQLVWVHCIELLQTLWHSVPLLLPASQAERNSSSFRKRCGFLWGWLLFLRCKLLHQVLCQITVNLMLVAK